jgi:23S rRNA (uracil1939-C5)-methyltransferase
MKKRSPAQHSKLSQAELGPEAGPVSAVIEVMGAQGHGVAQQGREKMYIPFTLPGEHVLVERSGSRARLAVIESPSPDRIQPRCKHFGVCGGCALQHWRADRYEAWKAGLVSEALARAGVDAPAITLRTYPVPSRRRATFTASTAGGRIALGYHAERSRTVINLEECPILAPALAGALPHLKAALAEALPARSEAKVSAVAAANGLDCAIDGPFLGAAAQRRLIGALSRHGFIRVLWNGDLVLATAAPFVLCGDVEVPLPANAFLQAVEACERDMAAFSTEALSEAKVQGGPLCDLFAGFGAFTFQAARYGPVTAYEANMRAVEALTAAAKHAKGIKPVSAFRRDLYRNPLGPSELNRFAAVIADPPREGAEAQCRALAVSKVAAFVMLSCNPAAFARDAALLAKGGFQLSRLAVFDQFRFSHHVEIAALFSRRSRKKGGLSPAPAVETAPALGQL